MPNLNYRAGRRLEYGRKKHWQKRGYGVIRASGSHGDYDLVGIHRENPDYPVELIQCKRVKDIASARRLIEKFKANPPYLPSPHYHQVMEVQVKGSKEVLSATV